MTRLLVSTLALATLLVSARPASAETLLVYETVDAVDIRPNAFLQITGIQDGDTVATEKIFSFRDVAVAARCDRLALLALSKPGKFQLVIVDPGNSVPTACRLRLRTP